MEMCRRTRESGGARLHEIIQSCLMDCVCWRQYISDDACKVISQSYRETANGHLKFEFLLLLDTRTKCLGCRCDMSEVQM
jgi:hypothetical protein